ncbi:MAG: 16S rRNA (cytosine(967)-C(5))-methyltransferase [Candidatus Parabeggiatoa sp. nov. 3]|nr:MAG: 16S rRNA (cytosine(967)-C(5))-methyltransferase [Gammaproteobacteria bacterium]RKZ67129.1 MAG: 16S rRNA (cytosine(967)-C(5))-methyltransferase [Gammaproteobacteria bacterium]RKZ87825.1 MAG: 16S rRNA (cytosine(967)-C(5))-methyltransferase [Gammaproteobacteria bacterium]
MDARSVATQILTDVIGHKRSLSDSLDTQLDSLKDGRDRALAQALCYGVLRWLPRLQTLLRCLLRKPLNAQDSDIHVLLLIGLYQHLYLRIPPHAATAATVEVTRRLKKPWATPLVNAILRNFQRQRNVLLDQVDKQINAKLAHPPWLLERLQADWPSFWETIVEANNTQPPLTLRVNTRCLSRDAYLELLQEAQIAATPTAYTEAGLTLVTQGKDEIINPTLANSSQQGELTEGGKLANNLLETNTSPFNQKNDQENNQEKKNRIFNLPGFTQGWISVQDGAAQLAASLLDVPAGARVLDACAAPGGKTAHLLERYEIETLLALDNKPERVEKLANTLQRLQLSAQVRCADVSQPDTWWDGHPFERILLDVPCSGSGIIRRHPDIKYLRKPKDIKTLAAQQKRLLEALWPLLKPGGQLLYVTCSVFAEENHLQIKRFLDVNKDAQEIKLAVNWGHALPNGRQILPGEDNLDGFYYACLSKKI